MKNLVFVISLKSDEARREKLKERFKNYGEFKLVEATDGRAMSAKEYYGYALPGLEAYGRLLSPSEVGCSLSHARAYEEFLKSDARLALILEDDVIGDESGIKKAFETAAKMDAGSALICGAQDGLEGRFSAFGKKLDEDFWLVSKRSYGTIYRAAAYVLDRRAAEKILQTHKKALCVADFWQILLLKNGLKMYFSDIFAHPLDLSGSNIQAERVQRARDKASFKTRLNSLKYVVATRFESVFCGFERIFKR
ncbi:glycosyltransferase family 25 protein [Campylobacter rectus]|uniref:glycosyltransferase family 25 protein n=1 Tax=Campylobacter rectus TaxID=203 RepID=UPI0028E83D23|nr:glycosyltransferase family 25 protein [Campylobacter rectus]